MRFVTFKPEEYWSIEGEFRYKKSKFTAKFLHYKINHLN